MANTLTDKLRDVLSMEAPAGRKGFQEFLSEHPEDSGDHSGGQWGFYYGVAYGIARGEEPYEADYKVAERAHQAARTVWIEDNGVEGPISFVKPYDDAGRRLIPDESYTPVGQVAA